jgi:predicted amino acid dehydrogenase
VFRVIWFAFAFGALMVHPQTSRLKKRASIPASKRPILGLGCLERWRGLRSGEGEPRTDIVLITHPRDPADLRRLLPWADSAPEGDLRSLAEQMRPVFGEIVPTPRFTAAYLFLPAFGDTIMDPRTRGSCRLLLNEALRSAAEAGARTVCLGGLTASLSGYGRRVRRLADELGLRLTTGHSMTGVSVYRTYRRALAELGLEARKTSLCVAGLGSVGGAFLRLLELRQLLPASLTIIERPSRADHVRAEVKRLCEELGVAAQMELTEPNGSLVSDSACYRSQAIVSAVSTTEAIDPHRVAPGTVLVDDSQPPCWSRAAAWKRCRDDLDIVPCEAGLIDCSAIGFRTWFPFGFATPAGADGSPVSWCCLAEGMLLALDPALPATEGEPSAESLIAYDDAFDRHGLVVAPLQCDARFLPMAELSSRMQGSRGQEARRPVLSRDAVSRASARP